MRAAALLALVPLTALAQAVSLETVGAGACAESIAITWKASAPIGVSLCKSFEIWVTDSDCADTPPSPYDPNHNKQLGTPSTSTFTPSGTGNVTIAVKDLPGLNASSDGGIVCGTQGVEKSYKACAAFSLSSSFGGTCTPVRATAVEIDYDAKPPAAPVIDDVLSGDTSLSLAVSVDDDVSTLKIKVRGPGEAEFTGGRDVSGSVTNPKISGLNNGDTYDVITTAQDAAGNESGDSNMVSGTPIKTKGIFGVYRSAGGRDQGCAVGAGASLLALGLVAWRLRRRS
jgi:hypothetical protein